MKELSLNILDIAQNSIHADASLVEILLGEENGVLTLTVRDNGKGMSEAFVSEVTDPFRTTRTTRKVGMGLPLLKLAAEQAGGTLTISSTERAKDPEHGGTVVTATFDLDNIDCTPLGDVISTLVLLLQGDPQIDFVYRHRRGDAVVSLDTREMREQLGGVPLNEFEVLEWVRESLKEQYAVLDHQYAKGQGGQ